MPRLSAPDKGLDTSSIMKDCCISPKTDLKFIHRTRLENLQIKKGVFYLAIKIMRQLDAGHTLKLLIISLL